MPFYWINEFLLCYISEFIFIFLSARFLSVDPFVMPTSFLFISLFVCPPLSLFVNNNFAPMVSLWMLDEKLSQIKVCEVITRVLIIHYKNLFKACRSLCDSWQNENAVEYSGESYLARSELSWIGFVCRSHGLGYSINVSSL